MKKRLSKKTRFMLAGALGFAAGALFVLFGGAGKTQVYADDILYSGTDDSLEWSITESGVLTIEGTGNYGELPWLQYANYCTKAVINVDGITCTDDMFYGMQELTEIDLSGLDTSQVTSMRYMFYDCCNLSEIDVSGFDTSYVESMSFMFGMCESVKSLDVNGFDTSRVKDMSGMFFACQSLTEINVGSFDTSKVTDMSHMFQRCTSVTEFDVSAFDTSNVTTMSRMFAEDSGISEIDLSSFDTSNVTDLIMLFKDCTALTEIDLSGFDTGKVTDMSYMFCNCTSLEKANLSGFNTSSLTSTYWMFYLCSSLTELDLSSFNMDNVTKYTYMLSYCYALFKITMPANTVAIELPSTDNYYWADANAVTCTAVTAGLSTSMTYYRYADDEEATTAESTETTTQTQTTQSQTTTQAATTQNPTTTTKKQTTTTQNQTTTTQGRTTTAKQSNTAQTPATTEEPTVVVSDDDIDLAQSVEDDTEVDVNLATPVLTCAVNESEGVLVNWEAVEGATSYRVYRQTGSDGWEAVADTAAVSYTDTTAQSGSVCAYTVCAILTEAGSEQRSESGAGKSTVRLETPSVSGITRDGQDTAKLTVRWQGVGTVTGYQIQYSADETFEEGTITLTIESPSVTAAELLTAAEGSVYVRVRSYTLTTSGAKYFSDWSGAAVG